MINVRLQNFEGPLNLLLELIEQDELEITQISLAKVTDQYLKKIDGLKEKSIENLSQFIDLAAKLLLIKSRAILPELSTREAEEEAQDLQKQLIEFKKYKYAAKHLHEILSQGKRSYKKGPKPIVIQSFLPPEDLNLEALVAIYKSVIAKLPEKPEFEEDIIFETISIEDKILHLKNQSKNKPISLTELIKACESKTEAVVTFLAALELIKSKLLIAVQNNTYSDIQLKRNPEYAKP